MHTVDSEDSAFYGDRMSGDQLDIHYRLAEVGDADDLAAVHIKSWRAAYKGLIAGEHLDALDVGARADAFRTDLGSQRRSERGVTWIVAERDGVIIGHAVSQFFDGAAVLHMLYLDPELFGHGVGYVLHEMALRGARRLGADTITLKVLDGNQRAIDFYERLGWDFTGKRYTADWSGISVAEIEMRRGLGVDLLEENRTYWNGQASWYADSQQWSPTVAFGVFSILDSDVHIFPDVEGLDVVELGCGTAYVSKWALDRGARSVIGLDNSPAQLATAQLRAEQHDVALPLVMGDAHRPPFADNSFDVAINEYGAAIWCDPHIWIPEAARILRPGGLLWFLGNSVLSVLCAPEFEGDAVEPLLLRPQRRMHRTEWLDTNSIDFHVSHGEMISILTKAGFVIEALHELYSSADATTSYSTVTGDWAAKWPVEDVWVARLSKRQEPSRASA